MKFDAMDRLAESQHLEQDQVHRMNVMDFSKIWAMEETKTRQRSRDRAMEEGNRNTRFFQAVANQRRKTMIQSMVVPHGTATNTEEIQQIATGYYKNLSRYESRLDISISDIFFP